MIHLFMILSLSIIFVTSGAFAKTAKTELEDYTQIQTLLAKDTFAGVTDAAKKLSSDAKLNHHAALSGESQKLSLAKDLKDARELFIPVSNQMLPIAKSEHDQNLEVVYCPMKKARWVQKKGTIANPYYGSEMLECGVKEKEN